MKKIITYFPVLSVFLIFIGYCHLHFFYCSQFDIDIYQFITSGEIILSFLPIVFVLFLLGIIIGFIFIAYEPAEEKKEDKPSKARYIPFTSYKICTGKSYNWYTYWKLYSQKSKGQTIEQKLFLLYKIFFHINFLFFLGWTYCTYYVVANDLYKDQFIGVVVLSIWLILFFVFLRRQFHLKVGSIYRENYNKNIYIGCFLVLGFLICDYAFMYYKAEGKKRGNDRSCIKFEFDGKQINTFKDKTISYLGSTQQYIFLYNINNGNKYLYDKARVKDIVFGERPQLTLNIDIESLKKDLNTFCDSVNKNDTRIKNIETKKIIMNLCDSLNKYSQ